MPITPEGLVIKRYDEIIASLQTSLRGYLGNDIDLSENAILGIINTIYAYSLSEQWEMSQAVYNAFNIEVAEGKQLEDLVALVGLQRLGDAPSTGNLELSGVQGTLVPQGTIFPTDTSTEVSLNSDVVITAGGCYNAEVRVTSVVMNSSYVVSVNGKTYIYSVGNEATTEDDILVGLTDAINNDSFVTWRAVKIIGEDHMTIIAGDLSYSLAVQLGSNLEYGTITSVGGASVTEVGAIRVLAGDVDTLPTPPIDGLTSVYNTFPFSLGRLAETDEELRARHALSTTITGSSSPDAIEAAVRAIDGVSFTQVFENTTMSPDARGLPAKSFEVIVEGGVDPDIASVIYRTKPAGIQSYGNTAATTVDQDGEIQGVFFTRPTPITVYVKVEYTLYDEEVFPANGEDIIKQAVVDYGNTLGLGEDVIAQRFNRFIYAYVDGIENLYITVGVEPDNVTLSRVSIDDAQRASIIESNVEVSLSPL